MNIEDPECAREYHYPEGLDSLDDQFPVHDACKAIETCRIAGQTLIDHRSERPRMESDLTWRWLGDAADTFAATIAPNIHDLMSDSISVLADIVTLLEGEWSDSEEYNLNAASAED